MQVVTGSGGNGSMGKARMGVDGFVGDLTVSPESLIGPRLAEKRSRSGLAGGLGLG